MTNKTGCECKMSGFCSRHFCHKSDALFNLCKNNNEVFNLYELGKGPCIDETLDDKKKLPPITKQITNFTKATFNHIKNGRPKSPDLVKEKRLEVCNGCEYLNKESRRCTECGCFVDFKAGWADQECPLKKWIAYNKIDDVNVENIKDISNPKDTKGCNDCV